MSDAETQKQMTAAEHVQNMLNSDGWRVVKDKLDARILDLQNINNIDVTDASKLSIELLGRKLASQFLFDWLKQDVYGFVEQQRENNREQPQAETFIERHKS